MRTYYHLLALESFMRQMKIDFSRDFPPLTPPEGGVRQVIRDDARISLASGRIQLELNNMRPNLNNFPPLPKVQNRHFLPIIHLFLCSQKVSVIVFITATIGWHYSNRDFTQLTEPFQILESQ